jgi:hypothetical protein
MNKIRSGKIGIGFVISVLVWIVVLLKKTTTRVINFRTTPTGSEVPKANVVVKTHY